MSKQKNAEKLNKFLHYALGLRPDELGMAPDPEGWVPLKELLTAFSGEEGWSWVRKGAINEVLLTAKIPAIELDGDRVRAKNPDPDLFCEKPDGMPKLLFTCVRERAWPVVADKGIRPMGRKNVVLAADKKLAQRTGRPKGAKTLLTVHVGKSREMGVEFTRVGELLYLTEFIPQGAFSGPPVPKEKPEPKKTVAVPEAAEPPTPGSFFWEPQDPVKKEKKEKGQKGKQRKTWKEEARRQRRRGRG